MAEKIFDWLGALMIVGVLVWLLVVQSGHGTPAGGSVCDWDARSGTADSC